MGYGPKDKLSIVSFNSQREALKSLHGSDRLSYLRELFENVEPGIGILPGDDDHKSMVVLTGYKSFLKPGHDNTVLLYDCKTVEMKEPQVNLHSLCADLPFLDVQELLVADVTVSSLEPYTRVVKDFNIITWRYDYLHKFNALDGSLNKAVTSIILKSQRLSLITNKPTLIAGELNMSSGELESIVKECSKDGHKRFMDGMEPVMKSMGYTRPIANTALTEQRHLFMMDVIKCSNNGLNNRPIVNTWESTMVADCFIASKQLKLADATLMDIEKVIGRKVCAPLQTYRPTQTYIDIPVRPPKHHGG